jgi:hypothetical protein
MSGTRRRATAPWVCGLALTLSASLAHADPAAQTHLERNRSAASSDGGVSTKGIQETTKLRSTAEKKAKRWDPMPLGIVFTAVGALSLTAAAVSGALYVKDRSIVDNECTDDRSCTRKGMDAAERAEVLGRVSVGNLIGGGLLVTAGVGALIGSLVMSKNEARETALVPALSHDTAAIAWTGTF